MDLSNSVRTALRDQPPAPAVEGLPNRHPMTGIPFGIIRHDAIDPEVWERLTVVHGKDVRFQAALAEHLDELRAQDLQESEEAFDEASEEQRFSDAYRCDEPVYEGSFDGVKYRAGWMGGAPVLWVFESPVVAWCRETSPCVPGAGDLNGAGAFQAYGVPVDWLMPCFMEQVIEEAGHRITARAGGFGYVVCPPGLPWEQSWPERDAAVSHCYAHQLQEHAVECDPDGIPTEKGSAMVKTLLKSFWDQTGFQCDLTPPLARLATRYKPESDEAVSEYLRESRFTLLQLRDGNFVWHPGPRHLSLDEARRAYARLDIVQVAHADKRGMELDEIRAAVDEGRHVYWKHTGWKVVRGPLGHYFVAYAHGDYSDLLTDTAGLLAKGRPEDYFVIVKSE